MIADEFSVGVWIPVGGGDGEIVCRGRTVGILDFYSDASICSVGLQIRPNKQKEMEQILSHLFFRFLYNWYEFTVLCQML